MPTPTCFVISPIGDPGSDIRKNADDFYDLIVLPAVEKFGFDVVRADKIAGTGSITEDVLRLVQESELCIVDLTGHNPNVFYECGRRHETGRPYIQLIEHKDRIPFDLAGIRTIKYQLADARTVRKAVTEIQAFIAEAQKSGFSQLASGSSMTAISETLARIERRISKIESGSGAGVAITQGGTPVSLMTNPLKALQEAIVHGDLNALVQLLPRLETISTNAARQAAQLCAINGLPIGADFLRRSLEGAAVGKSYTDIHSSDIKTMVASLVQYYVARDEEPDGRSFLEPHIRALIDNRNDLEDSDRAFLHNQLSILQHGSKDYSSALESLERAVKLAPDERSYQYNISIIYENLKLLDKACQAASCSIAGETNDEDHLAHAIDVYLAAGKTAEAESAIKVLQRVNPARAAYHGSQRKKR